MVGLRFKSLTYLGS
ncbi:hypothetical protein IQ268_09460 [Oculatella sp. LEGE 06141]|nr:hypothetical protein [Oculatella sp. LEGE 06141]